jgi:uncharacterized protein
MKRRIFNTAAAVTATAGLGAVAAWWAGARQAAPEPAMPQIRWDELAPRDGSLERYFGAFNREEVTDWAEDDPRALAILSRLKVLSRDIPTLRAWEGRQVALPGFAVMYGDDKLLLQNFFLAPYQGACVHRPPPPGNQLVHVHMAQPMPLLHAAYPLLMRGRLRLRDTDHPVAFSRYTLVDAQYEHFDPMLQPTWLPAYPLL